MCNRISLFCGHLCRPIWCFIDSLNKAIFLLALWAHVSTAYAYEYVLIFTQGRPKGIPFRQLLPRGLHYLTSFDNFSHGSFFIRHLVFICFGKIYIVCDVCGLRSPSFESRSVLYISPTDTSSMENLILEGLQQKLQKSCSRCNKNTRHVESSYILQPPKYLLLFVNRCRYINNNIT